MKRGDTVSPGEFIGSLAVTSVVLSSGMDACPWAVVGTPCSPRPTLSSSGHPTLQGGFGVQIWEGTCLPPTSGTLVFCLWDTTRVMADAPPGGVAGSAQGDLCQPTGRFCASPATGGWREVYRVNENAVGCMRMCGGGDGVLLCDVHHVIRAAISSALTHRVVFSGRFPT